MFEIDAPTTTIDAQMNFPSLQLMTFLPSVEYYLCLNQQSVQSRSLLLLCPSDETGFSQDKCPVHHYPHEQALIRHVRLVTLVLFPKPVVCDTTQSDHVQSPSHPHFVCLRTSLFCNLFALPSSHFSLSIYFKSTSQMLSPRKRNPVRYRRMHQMAGRWVEV